MTQPDAAVRRISETAHDLRSPLASIRKSIRSLHDGDLGPITSTQQGCLSATIDQCDRIDRMIGEMVQPEHRRGIAKSQSRLGFDRRCATPSQ